MSASSTRVSTPLSNTSHNTPKPSTSTTTTSTPRNKSQSQPQQHAYNAAYNLLSKAHPNDSETASKIFNDKIAHKPLLLSTNTNTTTTGKNSRSARRHIRLRRKAYALKHARPKPLSAKEKRALKLYDLQPTECRYEIYKGLNTLWQRYILEVLGYVDREGRVVQGRIGQPVVTTSNSGAGAAIASADFHGMEVEVVACVDLGRVGTKGIVVRETRSTLVVVCDEKEDSERKLRMKRKEMKKSVADSEEGSGGHNGNGKGEEGGGRDKVRMILKKGTVFRVTVDLPNNSEVEDVAGDKSEAETGTGTSMLVEQANSSKQSNVEMMEGEDDVQQTVKTAMTTEVTSAPKRQLVFELHGDQLEIRPIERAVKKFKWKPTDYL